MEFPSWIKSSPLHKELISTYENEDLSSVIPPIYLQFHEDLHSPEACVRFIHLLKYWCVEANQVPLHFFDAIIDGELHLNNNVKNELQSFDSSFPQYNVEERIDRQLLDYAIIIQHLPLIYHLKVKRRITVFFQWELYRMAIRHKAFHSFVFLEKCVYNRNEPFLEQGLFDLCFSYESIEILKHIYTDGCFDHVKFNDALDLGIDSKSYHCLQFILSKGASFSSSHLCRASQLGHLSILQLFFSHIHQVHDYKNWLRTQRIFVPIAKALACPSLECVKFLFDFIGEFDLNLARQCGDLISIAVAKNSMECLEYMLSKGFPLTIHATNSACRHGHLNMLTYLHSLGCPWEKECFHSASANDHEDCFVYLLNNGCPRPKYCLFG